MRLLAQRMLEKRGHTVTVAANGKEALAALEASSFQLFFVDVQMPEMNGFQATAAIREREKKSGTHVPIVAMTAHAMVGDQERCQAAGMDDYLSKPIRLEELSEIRSAILRGIYSVESGLNDSALSQRFVKPRPIQRFLE